MPLPHPRKPARSWLLPLFFLSGASGLIYQIAWVRQSVFTFGVSIYAYSAVIGAYMIGLALGSYVLGRKIDSHKRPLRTYAVLEAGIALLAALSPFALAAVHGLYPGLSDALPAAGGWLTAVRLALSLAVLTPATFLIGATLPVMSRIYATRRGRVGSDVGAMYLANTIGAAVGCAGAGLILLRMIGTRETIFLGAGINLLVAAGACAALRFAQGGSGGTAAAGPGPAGERALGAEPGLEAAAARSSPETPLPPRTLRYLAAAYGVSGFIALGYEIVWARILYIHSSHAVYSFSIMLAVFLCALALGSAGGSWLLRRKRAALRHFGALQLAIGLLAIGVLHAFAQLPALHLEERFGGYTVAYEFLLAFVTLFPPALLLGVLFPVVGSLYTRERSDAVGLRIGLVNALNTVGAIAGSLGAGFVLIPLMGLRNTALLLAGLNIAIGAAALWFDRSAGRATRRWVPAGVAAAAVVAILALSPGRYLGSYYDQADRLIYYKEGVETTVAVLDFPERNFKISFVNGRDEVPTDQASMAAFRLLGHLPYLFRPGARNAAVLSFGNGIATGTLDTHDIPTIDAVDLSPEMVEAAAIYKEENYDILASDRLRLHIEDGRNFLLRAVESYDIISVDATHPANASSWALFTLEFYRLVDRRLADDGVFMQWIPIHGVLEDDYRSILRTVREVFPHTTLWSTGATHSYVVATREPMTAVVFQSLLARAAANPTVTRDLGPPETIVRYLAMPPDALGNYVRDGPIVTDNTAFFLPSR